MTDDEDRSLIPLPDVSLANTAAGAKRIMSEIIGETLALARFSEVGKTIGITKAADSEIEEMLRLARINDGGTGFAPNYEEAFRWYSKAAELGSPYAQYCVGTCFLEGQGVPKDAAEAVKWFLKAAQQKPPGFSCAQHAVGSCYRDGQGVTQDYSEAVRWFRKAAENGLAVAQYDLATSCRLGKGRARDFKEAASWYEKAAEQGHARAQNNIGICYKSGLGVSQDLFRAYKWLQLAADQAVESAKSEAASLAALMSPSEFDSAHALYKEFKETHPTKQ
jgi:hypothetical protein